MDNNNYEIEELIKEYGNDVLRTAFLYVKNLSAAEDVFQDVFIKVYKNLNKFKGKSSIKTWIIRITINTSKDYIKTAWNKNVVTVEDYHDIIVESYDNYEKIETVDRDKYIINEIQSLPGKYKDVVICVYYNELSLKETAKFLNIPIGTVKSRLSRAKVKLKELFEGRTDYEM